MAPVLMPNFCYSLAVLSGLLELGRERVDRRCRATEAISSAASRFGSVLFPTCCQSMTEGGESRKPKATGPQVTQ